MTGEVAEFSEIGDRYGEQLARGLRLTGETAEYFARQRIARVATVAGEMAGRAQRDATVGIGSAARDVRCVLDFGCGTGASLPLLRAAFPSARLVGYEPADGLRLAASEAAQTARAELVGAPGALGGCGADVLYCNGVVHHVAPTDRADVFAAWAGALAPGGLVCVWENSPYNPGTRVIMSRIPFDRGAQLLTPAALRDALRRAGLTPVRTEYHFVFPRMLRALRPLEPMVRWMPLGGQYLVVARRD